MWVLRMLWFCPLIIVVSEFFWNLHEKSWWGSVAFNSCCFWGMCFYFNTIERKCNEVTELKTELASLKKEVEKLNGLSSSG